MADQKDDDLGFDDDEPEERLHPILTNEEVLAARASARKKVEAERKKVASQAVENAETARLKVEEGLTTGHGPRDEMVSLVVDLPAFAPSMVVNMVPYWHGHTYTVPRHVADSLREQMNRAWQHEDEVHGRSLSEHYGIARQTKLNRVTGAVSEAPKVVYDA